MGVRLSVKIKLTSSKTLGIAYNLMQSHGDTMHYHCSVQSFYRVGMEIFRINMLKSGTEMEGQGSLLYNQCIYNTS